MDVSVQSSTLMSYDITVPEDKPSESIAFHLLVTYDEIPKHIAIYNDDYKFIVFSLISYINLQLLMK